MPSPVQRKCIFAYTQPPKAPTLSPLALGYQELCCTLQTKPQLILTPTHKALIVPLSWQMRRTKFVFYGRQKSTRHGYKKGWLFEPRMSCFQKKEGPLPAHKCSGAPVGTCPCERWADLQRDQLPRGAGGGCDRARIASGVVGKYGVGESEVRVTLLNRVRLFATPWTVAYQAFPSMGFSRQEYYMGCHFLLQGIFPTQGSNPGLCIADEYNLYGEVGMG